MMDLWQLVIVSILSLPVVAMVFGCGACLCNCVIFSDPFTRSNSTNIGSNWTEVNGDFSIVSNALSVSSTGAIAKCNTPAAGTTGYRYTVTVGASASDKYRLFVNYTDSSNWHCAEFNRANAHCKLIACVSGTETVLAETVARDGGGWSVCVDDNGFFRAYNGGTTTPGNIVAITQITPVSAYVAVGTGGTVGASVTFDAFSLEAFGLDTCAGCGMCGTCPTSILRQEMQLTLSNYGIDGGCALCAAMDGTYVLELVGGGSLFPSGHNGVFDGTCAWSLDIGTVCGFSDGLIVRTSNGNGGSVADAWMVVANGCTFVMGGGGCDDITAPSALTKTGDNCGCPSAVAQIDAI